MELWRLATVVILFANMYVLELISQEIERSCNEQRKQHQ